MTHKVSQMNVAFGIQQHVIGFYIPVHNALGMYVSDSAT